MHSQSETEIFAAMLDEHVDVPDLRFRVVAHNKFQTFSSDCADSLGG
jgi:hypothetical protein